MLHFFPSILRPERNRQPYDATLLKSQTLDASFSLLRQREFPFSPLSVLPISALKSYFRALVGFPVWFSSPHSASVFRVSLPLSGSPSAMKLFPDEESNSRFPCPPSLL